MQPVTRARIFGGVAAATGAGLAAYGQWGPALAAVVAGAGAAFLVTDRGIPDALPDLGTAGTMASAAALVRDLRLEGRGILVPGGDATTPSRLFVPVRDVEAREAGRIPSHTVLQQNPALAMGALLALPGAGLERAWAAAEGLPQGRGAEEATDHVRRAFGRYSLGEGVVVARSRGSIRVAYRPRAFREACRLAREEYAPWHLQGGCPACSFAGALVARALGRPLRIADAGSDGERTYVEWTGGDA